MSRCSVCGLDIPEELKSTLITVEFIGVQGENLLIVVTTQPICPDCKSKLKSQTPAYFG